MTGNIFHDPFGLITFHDIVTEHRSGYAVYINFLDRIGKTSHDLSYGHFMVMLKAGTFAARELRPLCLAMTDCNLDPEPAVMAMYADCVPQIEPTNGRLDDEFCTVVSRLHEIAEQVKAGTPLAAMARQDIVALNAVVADIAAAARHMSTEIVLAVRTEEVA